MHLSNLYQKFRVPAFGIYGWRTILLAVCLISIVNEQLSAQNSRDARLSSLVTKVDSLIDNHNLVAPLNKDIASLKKIEKLFRLDFSSTDSDEVRVIEAEQKKLSRDLGLDLQAGYLENLEQGVFSVEGIYYRRRAQIGVEWDILNNGYLDHQHEIKELENEKRIAGYEHGMVQKEDEFDVLHNAIRIHFIRQKASLMKEYLNVLKDQHEVASELYELNYKPWEEVIEVTSRKARAEVALKNHLAFNRQFATTDVSPVAGDRLPLVDIHLEKLLLAGQDETLQDSILTEQVNKIDNEYSPLRDISLSTYVRYNYYNSPSDINLSNLRNREYFSVGLNLSVPLPLLTRNNKSIAEARSEKLAADFTRSKKRDRHELYSDYSRYQQKLQQYLQRYERYVQLNIRIEKQGQRKNLEDPAYSPIKVLQLLTDRYEVAGELITIKQEMYEILLSLREKVSSENFTRVLRQVNIDDYFTEVETSSRRTYIWSSTFADLSNEKLLDILKQKQIDGVLLSVGPDTILLKKASDFIERAYQRQISVELMAGNNNLLLPGHKQKLHNIFKQAVLLKAEGVHLDVEPHTKDDWDSREREYKELYLKMTKQADSYAKEYGFSLSVSIPVFYDSIISDLYRHTDAVYVMAYGTDSIEKVRERVEDEMVATGGDLVIALRPADFNSPREFEEFRQNLRQELAVKTIAIHDLEALIQLYNTEVTVNNYEE